MQTGRVHHDEHGVQALAGLAHHPGLGRVKAHHACGAAVQPHLFFDALAVRCAAAAIGVELGAKKQRQAFGAGRGVGQAGQHQMHDVVGEVVFAAGNKNLGATERVAAVSLWHGLSGGQAQVAAGMRLAQVLIFERLAGMVLDALVGAVQQARRHGPAMVGRAQPIVEHGLKHAGQALSAVFGGCGQGGPAGLPEGLVGIAKARRHGDLPVLELRAHPVADLLQGRDDLGDEFAGLGQELFDQCLVKLCKCWQGAQRRAGTGDLLQQEQGVLHVGLVIGHGLSTQKVGGACGARCGAGRRALADQESTVKPMRLISGPQRSNSA